MKFILFSGFKTLIAGSIQFAATKPYQLTEFQQNQQDSVHEIILARQNFNQVKVDEKTVNIRENPSNRIADLGQDELENKIKKMTQIKELGSSSKEFPKPFPIKENSEPLYAKEIQIDKKTDSSNLNIKEAFTQENKRKKIETTNEKHLSPD